MHSINWHTQTTNVYNWVHWSWQMAKDGVDLRKTTKWQWN